MLDIQREIFDCIDSNMYLLIEGREALLIDPHKKEDVTRQLKEHHVKKVTIILTHEHLDHVSGVLYYQNEFPCRIVANAECKKIVENPENRITANFSALFIGESKEKRKRVRELCHNKVHFTVDTAFRDKYEMVWIRHNIFLKSTPGHSLASICILIDNKYLFSGDTIIPGLQTETRFPGGNSDELEKSMLYLKSLDSSIRLYPGHGEPCTLGDVI